MRKIIFLALVALALAIGTASITAPHNEITQKSWSKTDSRAYARDELSKWQDEQWSCLNRLWGKESAWNPHAFNSIRVQGKHAGGIPQLLGLDPKTPPPRQIERGLDYIYYRYDTPCKAWQHFKKKGWH